MLTVIPRINVVSGIRAVSLWAKALSHRPKRGGSDQALFSYGVNLGQAVLSSGFLEGGDFGAICRSGSAEVSFIVNKWA